MKNTNACYFKFANKKTTNAVLVHVANSWLILIVNSCIIT